MLLRRPVVAGAISFAAIALATDALSSLDRSSTLVSWVGYVAAVFLLYDAAVAWFVPRLLHRPAAAVVEIAFAAAITPVLLGWAAWNFGASKGFLFAGAIESALLIVVVLVRASHSSDVHHG